MFKIANTTKLSGLERIARLTLPLAIVFISCSVFCTISLTGVTFVFSQSDIYCLLTTLIKKKLLVDTDAVQQDQLNCLM